MVARHTREIRDLAVVPVTRPSKTKEECLAVRLCVSGWLSSPEDVVAPWTVFGGDDTFALQWVRIMSPLFVCSALNFPHIGSGSLEQSFGRVSDVDQSQCHEIRQSTDHQTHDSSQSHELSLANSVAQNWKNYRQDLDYLS